MYILGLNEALCSSAAVLKDGEIIAAASEERFSRIKNHWGFPQQAINFCCRYSNIKSSQLDLVVLSYIDPYTHFVYHRALERPELISPAIRFIRDLAPVWEYKLPAFNLFSNIGRNLYYQFRQPRLQLLQIQEIAQFLKIPAGKIIRIKHHLAHAYSAYYANPSRNNKPTLVFVSDGAGDQECANIYVVNKDRFDLISSTPHVHSLGLFYAAVTSHLGLKAHEDEYKIMGLAPYATEAKQVPKIYQIFADLIQNNGLTFNSVIPSRQFNLYFKEKLTGFRFDHIAAAAQLFFENLIVKWINNAIYQTGINQAVFSGGVFLNVKANYEIIKRTRLKQVFFMPSPGDDTNTFGACFYGYKYLKGSGTLKPVSNLYFGPGFSQIEIRKAIRKYSGFKIILMKQTSKTIAKLLVQGKIVARFYGRMEFGARALGNRSILADPRNKNAVEEINRAIKMRDFWMPFAPTILDIDANKYLINVKKIAAPFMVMAFPTTNLGKITLAAAIHPYDKSVRPQILTRDTNPGYYEIIEEFKKLTGAGAILNTSFNIHGEPIVCTPADALSTFVRSGLKYLVLENYLIKKL